MFQVQYYVKPVSYTHLDVYKRQIWLNTMCIKIVIIMTIFIPLNRKSEYTIDITASSFYIKPLKTVRNKILISSPIVQFSIE